MTIGFNWKPAPKVVTGCKDCGISIEHWPAETPNYPRMERRYGDKDMTIYEMPTDSRLKDTHFAVIVRSTPEKMFLACGCNLEGLKSNEEIEKILKWTNEDVLQ